MASSDTIEGGVCNEPTCVHRRSWTRHLMFGASVCARGRGNTRYWGSIISSTDKDDIFNYSKLFILLEKVEHDIYANYICYKYPLSANDLPILARKHFPLNVPKCVRKVRYAQQPDYRRQAQRSTTSSPLYNTLEMQPVSFHSHAVCEIHMFEISRAASEKYLIFFSLGPTVA